MIDIANSIVDFLRWGIAAPVLLTASSTNTGPSTAAAAESEACIELFRIVIAMLTLRH